jgi:hypothetical protein
MHYAQVRLHRPVPRGRQVHTAWIPSGFAVVGKYIVIDSTGPVVWEVVARYGSVPAEQLLLRERASVEWKRGRLKAD